MSQDAGPTRILIVEDEPIQATVLSEALARAGFQPTCIDNGAEVVS